METNKIYNENCLETMAKMPDCFVDLTVTSPPYNLGVKHHTGNNIFKAKNEWNTLNKNCEVINQSIYKK